MYPHIAHVFVDGGYLRELGREYAADFPNPRSLAKKIVESPVVQSWASDSTRGLNALLSRITFYDALPEEASLVETELKEYWRQIELEQDTHLGFGALRGLKRRARQKGVDVLLAVDMLSGAFSGTFDISVLVAGDADFVPVVEEVKRRGVMVLVAAAPQSMSEDLHRAADRFMPVTRESKLLTSMPLSARVTGGNVGR